MYVNFIRGFDHYPYLAHSIIVVNGKFTNFDRFYFLTELPTLVFIMLTKNLKVFNFSNFFENFLFIPILSAPPIFEVVAEVLNLRGPRRFRVKIFGTNKSEWISFLNTLASKEQLPQFLGGTVKLE